MTASSSTGQASRTCQSKLLVRLALFYSADVTVGSYSHEHRYRPAASPVLTTTDKTGRQRKHGDYHFT